MNEKILVINCGSTSFRFCLIQMLDYKILAQGGVENLGEKCSYLKFQNILGVKIVKNMRINSIENVIKIMNELLLDKEYGVIQSKEEIAAIGYRVVHGGEKYLDSVLIDEEVIEDLKELSPLMPLHGKNTINSINICNNLFDKASPIAVFDTTFHSTMPEDNYLYALPLEYYKKYGVRKYGFHGISYSSVLKRYAEITKNKLENINIVICHMGGGSSMCAIKEGKSYDTTMGFTPLSGLIMASRSGSVDPSIITYLMNKEQKTAEEIVEILNKESGYKGICNDKDAKSIVERSFKGDNDAIRLRRMADHDFKKNLLSMMANLENTDSIVLTGGMGTKNKEQREMFLSGLTSFGILLDRQKNKNVFDEEAIISLDNSQITLYVIPDNEEKEIVNECVKVLRRQ